MVLLGGCHDLCPHSDELSQQGWYSIINIVCDLYYQRAMQSCFALGIYPNEFLEHNVSWPCSVVDNIFLIFQALDTFSTVVVSPVNYVMFTTLTIVASAIMFKVMSTHPISPIPLEAKGASIC